MSKEDNVPQHWQASEVKVVHHDTTALTELQQASSRVDGTEERLKLVYAMQASAVRIKAANNQGSGKQHSYQMETDFGQLVE